MRKPLLALLTLPLLGSAALAWAPALDEPTAQKVIDTAFQRPVSDPKPTFQTVRLAVENGAFKAPGTVTQFYGPETCLSSWQAEPDNFAGGSRIQSVTASGQADGVYWQAAKAYKDWVNLKAADVLTEEARAARPADYLLRVDLEVSGAASEQTRRAYRVRLKSGETFVDPVRQSYVADWKQGENGLWSGTVVYYFDASPVKDAASVKGATESGAVPSGLRFDPNGQVQLQFMNERGECGYSVPLDLGSFI